ncbi:MAG TPA: hypothetical protein VK982_04350 [Bacteroidales bacterium]|nr:hypothetical protein [Bacteroidales bacterium]
MKKLIIFIGVLLLFTGCLTTNMIENNCDKFAQICTVDKEVVIRYRDTIIYVEKIIEVPVPGYKDSLRIRDSVNIVTVYDKETNKQKQYAELDTITKNVGLISAQAWVTHSELGINAWFNDSSFLYNYQDSLEIKDAIKDTDTTNTIRIRYIPKFYKFLLYLFIAQIVFIGIWLGFKYKSKLMKLWTKKW